MQTPILNAPDGSPEANYTTLHLQARSAVERCIGLLKACFRCLLRHHYCTTCASKEVCLSDISVCRKCKQKLTFGEVNNRGLGFKIYVKCLCGTLLIKSGPLVNNGYEINRRIVFSVRLLGVSREGINLFCGMMEFGFGLSQKVYEGVIKHMHNSVEKLFKCSCKKAVDEEKIHNEENNKPLLNLRISGDGSWKKRGYSSLYGVATLIGYYSGKVVDLIVKGSYCQTCTYYKNDQNNINYLLHKDEGNCAVNHTGSSGKMEVDAVKEMFLRSEEFHGVRYSTYVGDEDTKTFKALLDVEPYGEQFKIQKSECVGHVKKLMGTRLRNVKKTAKIGSKGKLTDVLIKKLTNYYGLAIRRNCESVENMKKGILATYYHLSSTIENPRHHNCPPGADSWCKWQVAQALGENFEHPPPLNPEVQKCILPIYEDLSRDDLLERCLGGHSQNANESFNATIWRLVTKHLNCGIKILEMSAYLAAGIFNEGYKFVLHCMQDMGVIIGQQSNKFANVHDN
ncbi:hypothetical protein J437_LFUL016858 [Ladona fulva]|uniref:Mutator-like transposase domain-containing protein n=1 Tax=Ladona fulva TaxID=123851 RepID=A0A8K0P946_LADFU|nr:hypothetical protein J437_LFUL016858 [Ladona fulva]